MICYLVLIYLVWFVHAPWWLEVPLVAGAIVQIIRFVFEVYNAGKESGNDKI